MQGAIVMTGYAVLSGEDASSIEAEQWETLHALAALQESFDFGKITRADENGSFRISFTTGEDTYFSTFYALEKDYLCTSYHTKDLKPDNDRLVEVPAMRLFPAATLIIEPNLPLPAETNSHYDIRFRWSMDPNDNPPWLSDFWSYCHRVREVSVIYNNKLRPNTLQSIHVPAGLEMTARIFHVKTSQWCPIIIENIKLEQGRVLDLGRRDFEPAMKVGVRAVDSKGEPVEGVTVSCFDEDGFWGQKVITNENGTAFANVRPRSKGEFVVSYHDRVTETHLREGIPYEVGGEEDAGRQFTLQISDEMLYQLFK
jgi:hypothetical protein